MVADLLTLPSLRLKPAAVWMNTFYTHQKSVPMCFVPQFTLYQCSYTRDKEEAFATQIKKDPVTQQLHADLMNNRIILPSFLTTRHICVDVTGCVGLLPAANFSICGVHLDHILAKAKGGVEGLINCQLMWWHWNITKGTHGMDWLRNYLQEEASGVPCGLTPEQLLEFGVLVSNLPARSGLITSGWTFANLCQKTTGRRSSCATGLWQS